VNVADGNLFITNPDVYEHGSGYTTALTRVYNSLDDETFGASFDDGWRLSAGEDELAYPIEPSEAYAVHSPDGSWTRFERNPAGDNHPSAGDLAYTAEEGVPETLVVHSNGTRTLTYTETGTEWLFDSSGNGFPQEIIEPEGEEGNALSLNYSGSRLVKVTDSHGHTFEISRHEGTGYIEAIQSGGEEWIYHHDESDQLTSYAGPGGQEAEYGYYGSGNLLHYVKDPSGTYIFVYDEDERVVEMRKLVNGTIETPGSEDQTTMFEYITPKEPSCESGRDTAETVVHNPGGASEAEVYCLSAAGELTEYVGREADGGSTAEEGEGTESGYEIVPDDSPDRATRAIRPDTDGSSIGYHRYGDYHDSEYESVDDHGTKFTGVASFSPPTLHWSYKLGPYWVEAARGTVAEKADVYTLPRGRHINYSDSHLAEPADYLFHSPIKAIALGQEYELYMVFEFACEPPGQDESTCITWYRHDFRLEYDSVE
jgi:hypothetical protein